MFFYSDQTEQFSGNLDLSRMNATKHWLRHFGNSLELKWLMGHPQTTIHEKAQARKEMVICERKMAFWARQPNYDKHQALLGAEELKRQWRK